MVMKASAGWTTERLELRPLPWDAVQSTVAGERLAGWADDFPDEGDVVVARMLRRRGPPLPGEERAEWGHYQVIERSSDLVVGGIGFFATHDRGVVELGYGIVPSRQGAGYATEAVTALVSAVWAHSQLQAVVAATEGTNVASQRVLEKAGLTLVEEDEGRHYLMARPPLAP
jgi:RimJ/RimL family protein N-acetyltransferase